MPVPIVPLLEEVPGDGLAMSATSAPMANICAAVLSILNKPAKAQEITACQLRPAVGIDVCWGAAGRLVDGHRFLLLTCPPEDTRRDRLREL